MSTSSNPLSSALIEQACRICSFRGWARHGVVDLDPAPPRVPPADQ